MKTLLFILLIAYSLQLTAQNIWYVDRDTPQRDNPTGQNGRSWATAWQDLDSVGYWTDGNGVNWNLISAGDTIYISGGEDSTTYTPEDHAEGPCIYGVTMVYAGNFTFADSADDKTPVIITKAWHENHNGDVYFVTRDDTFATGTVTSVQVWGDTIQRIGVTGANFDPSIYANDKIYNVDSAGYHYANIDTVLSDTSLALTNLFKVGEDFIIVRPQQRAFDLERVSNVKFVNLNFYNISNPYYSSSSVISIGEASNTQANDSLITFDGCKFYTRGSNAQIGMGSSKTTIKNCIIDMEESEFENDNDAMGFGGGRGGHTIDNNTIIFRNGAMTGGAHRDVFQFSNFGQRDTVEWLTTTISNNFIIDTRPEGIGWNAYIYSSGPYANQTFHIYNNIFVHQKINTNAVSIFMYHPDCEPAPAECEGSGGSYGNYREEFGIFEQSYHVLNNTFIMKGQRSGPITFVWSDSAIVKNNIFVVDTVNYLFYNLDGADGFPVSYKDIDYNLIAEKYYVTGGDSAFGFENGNNRTFTYWQTTLGYDVNSDTMDALDLTFVDKYDTNKASYYPTSTIPNGTDLSATYPFLANDALGNPRSATGWMGALDKNDYSAPATPTGVRMRRIIIQ